MKLKKNNSVENKEAKLRKQFLENKKLFIYNNREYIDVNHFSKRSSKTFIQKLFSYQIDLNLINNINKYSDFNDIVLLSKSILFNKRNKFVFILSFIFSILLRIISWSLFFGFYYLMLFLIKKYSDFDEIMISKVYFSLIGPTTLLYCVYVYCFVRKKDVPGQSSVRHRTLIDATAQNVKLWFLLKYFYKCKDIVFNLKTIKFKKEWNELLVDYVDSFSNDWIINYIDVAFYWNFKPERNINNKIKCYGKDDKTKLANAYAIDVIYYFKVCFCPLLPTIVCVIVYLAFK